MMFSNVYEFKKWLV